MNLVFVGGLSDSLDISRKLSFILLLITKLIKNGKLSLSSHFSALFPTIMSMDIMVLMFLMHSFWEYIHFFDCKFKANFSFFAFFLRRLYFIDEIHLMFTLLLSNSFVYKKCIKILIFNINGGIFYLSVKYSENWSQSLLTLQ